MKSSELRRGTGRRAGVGVASRSFKLMALPAWDGLRLMMRVPALLPTPRLPGRGAGTRIPRVPTLPLYVPSDARSADGSPHASRRVTAPGGYESWHFEAWDPAASVLFVATLYDGYPFHPGYLRAHARYLRHPTRVAPAVPAHYPCVSIAVYDARGRVAGALAQYPPGSFRASQAGTELRVGPHSLQIESDGTLRLEHRGVTSMTFRPRSVGPAVERRALSRELTGADHHWVLPMLYDVQDTITRPDGAMGSGGARRVGSEGFGYLEHRYGTAPIGQRLARWVRGWAVLENQLRTFCIAQPLAPGRPDEHHVGVAEGAALREVAVRTASCRAGKRTRWGLGVPSEIEIAGDAPGDALRLENGRVIESTPFSVRVNYDASDTLRPARGRAFCEIIYPQRLRMPGLGRTIERSIRPGKPSLP